VKRKRIAPDTVEAVEFRMLESRKQGNEGGYTPRHDEKSA
jgi:hypothetical protein